MIDGVKCGPDGIRADVDGNLWVSSNAGRNVGYSGVTVWNPAGQAHRPHPHSRRSCGNVCFGGPKRNRLFMAGEPVALRGLHGHARRRAGLSRRRRELPTAGSANRSAFIPGYGGPAQPPSPRSRFPT